ncbi:MAG: flagellar biosynthetic protein FliR [Armatimonadetes bacterium]|nr:flagellar biosynthetic protein FliR [Armatimonadota bacterium]
MPDLAAFSAASLWAFLQIFARVTSLFVTAPVFGSQEIPAQSKIGLAGLLSLVLLPIVRRTLMPGVPPALGPMVAALLGEALVGLLMGLIVSLLFFAVRLGGDLIDYQMGFSQAATFNPQFNESVSPIANFQYRYALVIYLLANGHWLLLAALERSFVALPIARMALGGHSLGAFTDLTFQMMVAGLQIAAPGAAVLLITDVAFAFLNRAVPQMQVFWVGMPVKVVVGLVMVLAALPLLTAVVAHLVAGAPDDLAVLLRGMHR